MSDEDEVGSMQGAPGPGLVAPTWTWGSSATIRVDNDTAPGPAPQFARTVSAQLAQVSLPEPAVCSLYFQATVESAIATDVVEAFTVNLNQGVGRTTAPRQVTFPNQPAVGSPLEHTFEFVPLHALNVDLQLVVKLNNTVGSLVVVTTYLLLSPITRIPQKEQKLAFGMALPGEADSMDDALLEDLEGEAPSVQEAVLGDYVQPEQGELEGQPPPWLMMLTRRLGRRLGRPPSRDELRRAVQARQARLHGRGAR